MESDIRKIIVIIIILVSWIISIFMQGCANEICDITDITKSTIYCKDKGGIKEITMAPQPYCECINGSKAVLDYLKVVYAEDNTTSLIVNRKVY